MARYFELWDVDAGNLIGTYESEERALVVVRQALSANGADYAGALALGWEDDDGRSAVIAKGAQLAARAEHAATGEAVTVGDPSTS